MNQIPVLNSHLWLALVFSNSLLNCIYNILRKSITLFI
ncbi:Hypothetical protein CFV354_1634 [Campylobacter fetus subsp. venerealis NCTC 10354]|nr:Hypothetical protein CFV354_1634 [Campylobacter fetus subsp. venerealis NCTC 10354]